MATIKALSGHSRISKIINYVTREDKTRAGLCTGIYCTPENAGKQMQATKRAWHKTGGRTYKHYVQSFAPGEKITPEQAHSLACKLADDFPAWQGYEVLIATHIDREHIHTHFIVNSVGMVDGKKLRWDKQDLVLLKQRSDELCRMQGLSIAVKGITFEGTEREEIASLTSQSYRLLKAAERKEVQSYIQNIALAVMDARETAVSREDFISKMAEQGYKTDWQERHRYITFTDLARETAGEKKFRVRNKKLSDYYNIDFSKEELENGFKTNARRAERREAEKRERTGCGAGTGESQKAAARAFIGQLRADERAAAEEQNDNIPERGTGSIESSYSIACSGERKNNGNTGKGEQQLQNTERRKQLPQATEPKAAENGRRSRRRSREADFSR